MGRPAQRKAKNDAALSPIAQEDAVRKLIQTSAYLLDREEFAEWIDLYAEESEYELVSDSPEIRERVTWWKADRPELSRVLGQLREHVNDPARRLHTVVPVRIEVAGESATAVSHFAVFRTSPEGASHLYAVGRYEDVFVRRGERWFYAKHRAVMDTAMLDALTHVPI